VTDAVRDAPEGPGWWMASDGHWYPPELHPSYRPPPPPSPPPPTLVAGGPMPGAPAVASQPPPPRVLVPPPPRVLVPPPPPGARPAAFPPPAPGGGGLSLWDPGPGSVPSWEVGPADFVARAGTGTSLRLGRRRRWRVGLAVLAAVGVVAGTLAVVVGTGSPAWPATWDPRIVPIVHFVEKERGLPFEHPVKVEFLSDAQFDKAVATPAPTSSQTAEQDATVGMLRALGLVHGTLDLAAASTTLDQADVVGLYVDTKKTVFVRGSTLTPYVQVTLAHELTHALQDQHFDLTSLEQRAPNGTEDALTALIEGDAVRTQNAYEQSLSPAEQQEYQQEANQFEAGSSAGPASDLPQILSDIQEFPYAFGPTFVDSLDSQGGTSAIDAAFADPPVSEAQILDPGAYPTGWTPAPVAAPAVPAGARVTIPATPFGQFAMFEVLGGPLGYQRAWTAVHGWQGDNSVVYAHRGQTCVAIATRLATPAEATALDQATAAWAPTVRGASVTMTGRTVDLRSCDPGPSAPAPPSSNPSAFDVLVGRAQIIDAVLTTQSGDFVLGRCVADDMLGAVGPSGYSEIISTNDSAAQSARVQHLFEQADADCQAGGVT